MATAGELALPAGAKGRLLHPHFARGPTIPAFGSLRRNASTTAPLLRLPPPSRYAATRSSLAAVRVGLRPSVFGRGSSGAEAGPYQMSGRRGSPNATGNADRDDGASTLDAEEMVRVAKIIALFLMIHEKQIAKQLWVTKLKNLLSKLLLLGFCLWIGYQAVKGDKDALLLVSVCDKGDKVYKIASAIKTMFFG